MERNDNAVVRESETTPAQGCQCQAQIADIQARLERLERDALTVDKLARTLCDIEGRSAVIAVGHEP